MPGKLLTTVWVFGSVLAWGMLRSDPGWVPGGLDEGLVLGFVLLPLLWSISDVRDMLWLLGLSAAIGAMPEWSVLPSIREYSHPVMLLMGLGLALNAGGLRRVLVFLRRSIRPRGGAERWAALFLLSCIVSMAWNALARGGAGWELWAGMYELVMLAAVLGVGAMLAGRSHPDSRLDVLVDGFAWGVLAQTIVVASGLAVIFGTPLMGHSDTALGLAYWDRVKGTFDGPDQAGIYLAAGVPLVMLWRERVRGRVVAILATAQVQLAPWLVIATGSRTARVALVLILVGMMLHATHRRKAFVLLPSTVAALAVGASFQSPRAMVANLAHLFGAPSAGLLPDGNDLAGMSLGGRMLEDERWELMAQGFRWMAESPVWQLILGAGLGVGGYGGREYPTMHNALDLLVETGMLGMAVLLGMLGSLLRRLFLCDRGSISAGAASARYLVGLALVAILIGGISYEVHMWGVTGVVLVMAWCASRMVEKRAFDVGRVDAARAHVASVGRRQKDEMANPT